MGEEKVIAQADVQSPAESLPDQTAVATTEDLQNQPTSPEQTISQLQSLDSSIERLKAALVSNESALQSAYEANVLGDTEIANNASTTASHIEGIKTKLNELKERRSQMLAATDESDSVLTPKPVKLAELLRELNVMKKNGFNTQGPMQQAIEEMLDDGMDEPTILHNLRYIAGSSTANDLLSEGSLIGMLAEVQKRRAVNQKAA